MNKKQILTLFCIYLLSVAWILAASVTLVWSAEKTERETVEKTEYIYVYREQAMESETQSVGWVVKEFSDRVAIFTSDGTLLQILDTYTKTLPEADRRLLREGIPIASESALYSIIEDYTE